MITKSEIKQAVLQDFGCDADDWLEAAYKSASGFEGARHALREAAKNVQQIAEVVDQDIENGEIDKLEGPLQIAAYAKKQVSRAVDSLALASKNYANRQIAAQGEIAAYERVVKYLTDKRQAEIERLKQLESALASGELQFEEDGSLSQKDVDVPGRGGRPAGVRPTMGVAAQRRAEESSASESKTTKKAVVKKKRGRPKGSKNKSKTGLSVNGANA